nr:unnamed protein product [Callosobruchus analis]
MTPREQRLIRKKWKENSKNYRLKKNQIEMEISMLEANTPPVSSDEENHPPTANLSFQRQIGRKIANKNKIKRYRQRKEAARKIQNLTRKVESYKKKYYRLLRKTKPKRNPDLTPVTKINLLLGASAIEHSKVEEVKKTLFGEVVQQQLANTYQQLKSEQKKQAFHFGGARQQITLHTVVVYTKYESETVPESYCTLSESLNHGPAAIWAHLRPILTNYTQNGINTIHFLSDSPATQYRNKEMFCFITNHFKKHFPEVKELSWNYHEAGHGKGAPDGIGGVCKRTADRVVSQGKDIFNLETLVNVLKECCPGISFYVISATDIDN